MIAGIFPFGVSADEGSGIQTEISAPENAEIVEPAPNGAELYNLWVGSTPVTSACLSGEGWSFDPDSNTLTSTALHTKARGTGFRTMITYTAPKPREAR